MVMYPKNAIVQMNNASAITISTSETLDTIFSNATDTKTITGYMKDISVTEAAGDISVINELGEDTDGFQNADIEESPPDLVEVSGTLVVKGDNTVEDLIYDSSESVSTSYTRYRLGKATRKKIAVLFSLDNGTDKVNWAGVPMILTSKETSVTGADGHFEMPITLKCKASEFYGPEFNTA